MTILQFRVRIENAESKDWNNIALRMARAARGRAKSRAVIIFAGTEDPWVLCENRDPAKIGNNILDSISDRRCL